MFSGLFRNRDGSLFSRSSNPIVKILFDQRLSDEFDIETEAPAINYGYNKIEIPSPDTDELRLIMLNVSQSVALDYYNQQTNSLLEETNSHTQLLERRGRINMGGIKLKKYIGRTLNLKNRISANLYIFDSPEETWENENLNKLGYRSEKNLRSAGAFSNHPGRAEHRKRKYGIVQGSFTKPQQHYSRMGCHHSDPR